MPTAPRRTLVLVGVLAAVAAIVSAVAVGPARREVQGILRPVTDAPLPAGPVMVLGGVPERVGFALALDAVALEGRELIASAGAATDLVERYDGDCDAPGVRCVTPDPFSTRGEARLAARLAAEEEWPALTVVTSDWHAQRARRHLEACLGPLGVPVAVVGLPDIPAAGLPWPVLVEELVGGLDARLRPECR